MSRARTSSGLWCLWCNAITHPTAPSVVAGLTCYTCVNVSDNQVSTTPPLNGTPPLLKSSQCLYRGSGPTAISFNSVRDPLSRYRSFFFFFPFLLIFQPPSPLVRATNLHSLSRPCRKGITDIGSSNDGGETRDKEKRRLARRLRRQGSTLSISLNRGSADGNLYRKSLIRNRVDGQGTARDAPRRVYPLSLPQFIPSILSPSSFSLSSSSLFPSSLPPQFDTPEYSTTKLYTRVTTTLHGERSIEGTTPSPNFVSSLSRTSVLFLLQISTRNSFFLV